MGSKGHVPPHLWMPHPGPGMMHPDPFGPGIRPPLGTYPPFDMLPPPELMEQKLDAQRVEMQRLATENQRLAATHATLRKELAAAQQELQRFQFQIGAMKNEKEQHMRGLIDKISKMEVDLQAVELVKKELQQARVDAQSLIAARQELMTKARQLTQDIQRTHSDVQQVPSLMSDLEGLRQEYQHCRVTYDYEKKLYNDHYESLQVMENHYISMERELEKLRAELANPVNVARMGVPYGDAIGYKENEVVGDHPGGQNSYEVGYGVPQALSPTPAAVAAPFYAGGTSGHSAAQTGYEVPGGSGYVVPRGPIYNAAYGSQPRGDGGPQVQVAAPRNIESYGSAIPLIHAGEGYEAPPLDGNPIRR